MSFCPHDECEHYSEATKYPKKCYYEPQCWRGWLDVFIALTGFSKKGKKEVMAIEEDKGKIQPENKGGLGN